MKCPYVWLPWIAFSPAIALATEPEAPTATASGDSVETNSSSSIDSAPVADGQAPADPETGDPQSGDPQSGDPQSGAEELGPPEATGPAALASTPLEALLEPAPTPTSEPEKPAERPEAVDLSAPDTLGGHFRLAISGQASFPAGNIATHLPMTHSLSTNFIAGLDLGFGISRHLTVGITGDYQSGYSTTECPSCSAQGFGAGLLVRHHLTQGLRFDPWLAFGLGIRSLDIQSSSQTSNYLSVEWLRLQVGGDFFIAPPVGLGPVIDFALSTSVKTDEREDPGSVGVRFGLGLRAVFDLPGRGR